MDPVTDIFIRIKNAQKAGHESVQISYSKFKHEIAKTLERSGFVGKIDKRGKKVKKTLDIRLLYDKDDTPIFRGVRFTSTPSRRLYSSYRQIRSPRYGGVVVVSTPKGVKTGREAVKEKVGGEIIAEVW